ncbi:unnamed protein product [Plutella xylostella]|uniref:(diamondback moth) hypothetical protein n=1 Tax=Plutella xylostella TaxID=51655 RepID=A0A8S4EE27_PLUXY|nr:unnamed protein product [Plutella xylostella]
MTLTAFTASAVAAASMLANLQRIQHTLVETLIDLHHGRVDTQLLRPEQLQQQLNIIARHIPNDLTLPAVNGEENIPEMYILLRVHSRMTSNYMIFEVKIPLVKKDSYELHKTITIRRRPNVVVVSDLTTEPKVPAKYIATNLKKDKIILFHDEDIHRCVHFTERLLCSLLQPIYDLKGSDAICEAQVIINKDKITTCKTELQQYSDKWIQLHDAGHSTRNWPYHIGSRLHIEE